MSSAQIGDPLRTRRQGVVLTEQQHLDLDDLARLEGRSKNSLVREAVALLIDRKKTAA